jgi:protein O-mannosyl-transferase
MLNRLKEHNIFILKMLLIIMVGIACYANSVGGELIWDDQMVIVRHTTIRSLKNIPELFEQTCWGEKKYNAMGLYRPLTMVTFAINYWISALDPYSYHVFNIAIHIINCLLIYWLVSCYLKDELTPIFTALIFAAHPVHVEAVTSVVGRSELLSAMFAFLAWLAYYYRERRVYYFPLSLLCYGLSLLSKENSVVFIGILFLVDLVVLWPQIIADWRRVVYDAFARYLPYITLTIIYLYVRYTVLGQMGVDVRQTFFFRHSLLTRSLTMSQALVKYLQLLCWPGTLNADYDFSVVPLTTTLTMRAALSLIFLIVLLGAGFALLWRDRVSAFAILYFFGTISIVSNTVFVTGMLMSERGLYFPSLGFCLLVGWGLAQVARRGQAYNYLIMGIIALAMAAMTVRCYYRNFDWHDMKNFTSALITASPNNPKGYAALGEYYRNIGSTSVAEQYYRKAVSLAAQKATYYGALAEILEKQGRYDEALQLLLAGLKIDPFHPDLHTIAGEIYVNKRNLPEAVASFRRAVAATPLDHTIHCALGVALNEIGNRAEAIQAFEKSLSLKPDFVDAHLNLGNILRLEGQLDRALIHLKFAAEHSSNDGIAHYNYGLGLYAKENYSEAEKELRLAILLGVNSAEIHNDLGVNYIKMKNYSKALEQFRLALRTDPTYENAQRNLKEIKDLMTTLKQ